MKLPDRFFSQVYNYTLRPIRIDREIWACAYMALFLALFTVALMNSGGWHWLYAHLGVEINIRFFILCAIIVYAVILMILYSGTRVQKAINAHNGPIAHLLIILFQLLSIIGMVNIPAFK